ncbi:threonine--tRNA ligase [Maridesulfovibrio salexigens]|uniref:Threonine--tRNA ligase n=1 Tax=Maridesulfovibrio salexigens (strain ATCC 14822 / DSM 2638 / NCIMB 8403 / VKM B-1763) TaxID=526222 RepID=SYT_MARSD|nr:threonine--tRNA ligase [Maridesulfovibrio salexigens]C6BRH1.1 RecName: Full=Threonine--tRNA ligase; AltName: Full=Threonyl-tRNA synthetase; Short=ThrRS [Maridesulfovibrio salexigens DSM 2638]ACS79411.1 threonyl-tRNA synthetase [Maridesulfovibrio salexigens DSM 2638]
MQVAGKELEVQQGALCGEVLKEALSKKQFKNVVVAKCGDTLLDLTTTVPADCTDLEPVMADSKEGLEVIRHSTAHLMAEAVKKLFPTAKVTIGPSIASGFYYDFDYERPFTPEDLEAIEAEMLRRVGANEEFTREVLSSADALKKFEEMGEDYKIELINDLGEETVSVYTNGEFADLCRGPHVARTGMLKAFKLLSVAGAYWRGDENRQQLQRIYGTAFPDPKALKKHLAQIEEAKKRDHRKLGTQLDLFSVNPEVGAGMTIWHPKGALIRAILEDFERKEHLKRGYQFVQGPLILKRELWEKSGHYDNYRENMYFTEIDEQSYGIKPMNCLSHMLVFKSRLRSYRDLPQRYFEHGVVHRHEKSGVLHGLLRVRTFTQDDAHLICRPDQLRDEIIGVAKFVGDVMGLFGFEYEAEVSTKPEKAIGSDEDWDRATEALEGALKEMGMEYSINEGDGAFYGPKIDIIIKDALERRWQCATIQCDFTLPERFDLSYVGEDGERHRPVMLHRVILGSIERFIGVLLEHTGGALPAWLSPVQAKILTVTDSQNEFAQKVLQFLREKGIRAEVDDRNEKLGYKVREAQLEKIPYMLVIGDKEVAAESVNVRARDGEDPGLKSLEEAAELISTAIDEPFKRGGMSYSFS